MWTIGIVSLSNKNNTVSVHVQVISNRKCIRKSAGVSCDAIHFNKNATNFKYISAKDSQYLYKNQLIRDAFNAAELLLLNSQKELGHLTNEAIKALLSGKKVAQKQTLVHYANTYIAQKNISRGTQRRYEMYVKKMPGNLLLTEITPLWLMQHDAELRRSGLSQNTAIGQLKFIRSVLNFAIDAGVNLEYPFGSKRGKFTLPTYINPKREYLSLADLKQIERICDIEDVMQRNAARWFLFQCATGMRVSELQKFELSNIKDSKIYITSKKVNSTHYVMLAETQKKALARLDKAMYSDAVYNRALNKIGEAVGLNFKLHSHIARHTFAVQYLNHGGSYEELKSMLGISRDDTVRIYGKITDVRRDKLQAEVFAKFT